MFADFEAVPSLLTPLLFRAPIDQLLMSIKCIPRRELRQNNEIYNQSYARSLSAR
jgi:hypothetical protein